MGATTTGLAIAGATFWTEVSMMRRLTSALERHTPEYLTYYIGAKAGTGAGGGAIAIGAGAAITGAASNGRTPAA
ncbi:hypothetical protein WR25_26252 [Diploscapter pachys]|uniref:Uncharacterized protein n=1 Tax=Diploscapter pachys TaxID=2018661 RepID=A0A2A2JSP8_9BILA|nr:hypothetical protein WR25_26252 [Diploscapter pachys]